MASSPEKGKQVSQVLYMPAVSVVVPESRGYQPGSLTYTYTQYVTEKPPVIIRMFNGVVGAIAFVIGVFLFAIPVTVVSIILINSAMSPIGNVEQQNQHVPGITKVVPPQEENKNLIRPAE